MSVTCNLDFTRKWRLEFLLVRRAQFKVPFRHRVNDTNERQSACQPFSESLRALQKRLDGQKYQTIQKRDGKKR